MWSYKAFIKEPVAISQYGRAERETASFLRLGSQLLANTCSLSPLIPFYPTTESKYLFLLLPIILYIYCIREPVRACVYFHTRELTKNGDLGHPAKTSYLSLHTKCEDLASDYNMQIQSQGTPISI